MVLPRVPGRSWEGPDETVGSRLETPILLTVKRTVWVVRRVNGQKEKMVTGQVAEDGETVVVEVGGLEGSEETGQSATQGRPVEVTTEGEEAGRGQGSGAHVPPFRVLVGLTPETRKTRPTRPEALPVLRPPLRLPLVT